MIDDTKLARLFCSKGIEAHYTKTQITERAFGIAAAGDHKFVDRLRAGHGVHSDTLDRANAFMAGKPMPPRVQRRPAPAQGTAA